MMKKMLIVVLSAISLYGCATPEDPRAVAIANTPLTCSDKQQCDEYWAKAQIWVTHHSEFRIQAVTDNIISTYGPAPNDLRIAYEVDKIPNGDGSATIEISATCGMTMFPCRNISTARADFKLSVRGGE